MRQHGQEPVKFEDIKDEIYDMVKPLNPLHITLQDLITRSVYNRSLGVYTFSYRLETRPLMVTGIFSPQAHVTESLFFLQSDRERCVSD